MEEPGALRGVAGASPAGWSSLKRSRGGQRVVRWGPSTPVEVRHHFSGRPEAGRSLARILQSFRVEVSVFLYYAGSTSAWFGGDPTPVLISAYGQFFGKCKSFLHSMEHLGW